MLTEQQIFLRKLREYFNKADHTVQMKDLPLGSLIELKSGEKGLYLGKGNIDMKTDQIHFSGKGIVLRF